MDFRFFLIPNLQKMVMDYIPKPMIFFRTEIEKVLALDEVKSDFARYYGASMDSDNLKRTIESTRWIIMDTIPYLTIFGAKNFILHPKIRVLADLNPSCRPDQIQFFFIHSQNRYSNIHILDTLYMDCLCVMYSYERRTKRQETS